MPNFQRLPHGRRVMSLLRVLALAALVAGMAATAVARHHGKSSHEGQAGEFDYYLLSLSWAPTYCLTHQDDSAECSGKGYGFVLHGLWPQYDEGGYPERCATEEELTSEAAGVGRTVYPSERLMAHEWQEHGTCTGLSALDYFHAADRATAVIRTPPELEAPRSDITLTAAQVLGLFQRANPAMPAGAMTVACSRAQMSEVRICLSKALKVQACGRGVHNSCPDVPLLVPASRQGR